MNKINVYFENRVVGRIEVHPVGPSFVYDSAWPRTSGAFPISTTIPLSATPVAPEVFIPWAANLLPEGRALRRVGELLHAAPEDVIKILSEIGRDTSGALSIGNPGSSDPHSYMEIKSKQSLKRIIEELPRKPFLAGDEGVSMSLAGVRTKLGVRVLESGNLAVPINGAASTHILKPNSNELFGSVQNEALCLTLANLCGFKTPEITTGTAVDRNYLLVPRYDRIKVRNRWRRLHQEDFCQALGKPPEAKYESNQTGIRGPTVLDMLTVARNTMPVPEVIKLLDYIIFNVAICNTDAHAKNYSLIITANRPRLAPLYDVNCTQVWSGITSNMFQSIAKKNRGAHLKRRHWEELAKEAGFNAPSMIKRIRGLLNRIDEQIGNARQAVTAMPAGDHAILDQVEKTIRERIKRLQNGLAESAIPQVGVAAAEMSSANDREKLDMREEYVSALREARTAGGFRKLVKMLENDRKMKAIDVKSIAHELLDRKFPSKKAAIAALATSGAPVSRLVS